VRQLLPAVPIGILLGALALSACDSAPPTGQAKADAATQAACRQRADQIYEQQNRGQIYSPQSQVNMPYSANYVPDVPNRGLSDVFAHDRVVSDCVRNTGTGAERPPRPSVY
jgi:hypothetical protein